MPTSKPHSTAIEPKEYLVHIPKRPVYVGLAVFAVVAVLLFLCAPHYKPLTLSTGNDTNYAHQDIIKKFFLSSTTCATDNEDKTTRIKEFNTYFKTNKYVNRAVIRGCNDMDSMLYKDDAGNWQRSQIKIILSGRQNPEWQKACLIDDITTSDTKAPNEGSSVDGSNLKICENLAKASYIEVNLKLGIHFHF
ncbi:hypothetical protein H7097_00950 [Aeromicrobium sp.]|nr:hypothetical protein [Candidatus Saccharibacteria bacterium]